MNESNGYNPKPIKSNTPLIIALVALCVVAVAVVASVTIFVARDKARREELAKIPPELYITSCPEQVTSDAPSVTIQGTMLDNNSACVLSIDGETVETAANPGETKAWSKTYQLEPGETRTFNITLQNEYGRQSTQTRTVFCQILQDTPQNQAVTTPAASSAKAPTPTGPLVAGSEFVKKKSGGLNIRSYAGTEYSIVDNIGKNDYTSRMVFTGYYVVGSDNYTWYEIISPNGKNGYVRSDLVTRVS